jgi:hypothetical protein
MKIIGGNKNINKKTKQKAQAAKIIIEMTRMKLKKKENMRQSLKRKEM